MNDLKPTQRLAKCMAQSGVCSRRVAEKLISAGRVRVNGKIWESLSSPVPLTASLEVDGILLDPPPPPQLFLFHKPRGCITTERDPQGRQTIFDVLPPGLQRLVTVGRLDVNTEGLMLLTNNGQLARFLELPQTGLVRQYRVRARGAISQSRLDQFRESFSIAGVTYKGIIATFDRSQGSNIWLTIEITEGKNREVKKILEYLHLQVNRLIRTAFGPFRLEDLPVGGLKEISSSYIPTFSPVSCETTHKKR